MSVTWPDPIPVAERLPQPRQRVIAWCEIHLRWESAVYYDKATGFVGGGYIQRRFTHWLPEPPAIQKRDAFDEAYRLAP